MPYLELLPFLQVTMYKIEMLSNRCQCPISSYSHFYAAPKPKKKNKQEGCQCPISSYSHFYGELLASGTPEEGVNALSRATPISTKDCNIKEMEERTVSMPYLELLPFLQPIPPIHRLRSSNVSMPYLELLPFLRVDALAIGHPTAKCQCPISSYSHFYMYRYRVEMKSKSGVSMPYLELLPFLQEVARIIRSMKNVSMPYLELLPFLHGDYSYRESLSITCVNALSRATPISTACKWGTASRK